jgi:hypothetical protein
MKCRNCNAIINYNYLTACPQCGSVLDEGDLPKIDPCIEGRKKEAGWRYYVANTIYVLVASAAGMVSGAVLIYVSAAIIYIALESPEKYPGQHCGRGMAVGMLSMMAGAFLGTVGGAVFSVKHLIPKRTSI